MIKFFVYDLIFLSFVFIIQGCFQKDPLKKLKIIIAGCIMS